jgi:hypothetical protein
LSAVKSRPPCRAAASWQEWQCISKKLVGGAALAVEASKKKLTQWRKGAEKKRRSKKRNRNLLTVFSLSL